MKALLYYTFIVLLFLSSCSKEDTRHAVTAGIYDSSFTYHEFSSPLKVELSLDTSTDNYMGVDSIDINQDEVYDIIISHRIHLPPESGTPSYEHFPYFSLTLKNGLQVATKIQSYPVGHGQLNEIYWVDALNYETRIDVWPDWAEKNVFQLMWAIPPVGSAPYGPWYDLANEEKYIGFRMKIDSRYKYGWIKVIVISREDMQFLSYAIEK
jgi:hypothetical protein